MKKILFVAMAVSFLSVGCVSVHMDTNEQSSVAKEFKHPDLTKAGIYVYRPSTVAGDGLRLDVFIDGECFGATGPNVFLYKEVHAGRYYTLASESVVSPNELKVYVSGGKNYFFRQNLTVEGLISGIYTAKLTEVSEDVGKKAVIKMDRDLNGKFNYDMHLESVFDWMD